MNETTKKLAVKAGFDIIADNADEFRLAMKGREVLQKFADLVAAQEREACAKECESIRPSEQEYDQRFYTACTLCANAIRSRGE